MDYMAETLDIEGSTKNGQDPQIYAPPQGYGTWEEVTDTTGMFGFPDESCTGETLESLISSIEATEPTDQVLSRLSVVALALQQ